MKRRRTGLLETMAHWLDGAQKEQKEEQHLMKCTVHIDVGQIALAVALIVIA